MTPLELLNKTVVDCEPVEIFDIIIEYAKDLHWWHVKEDFAEIESTNITLSQFKELCHKIRLDANRAGGIKFGKIVTFKALSVWEDCVDFRKTILNEEISEFVKEYKIRLS